MGKNFVLAMDQGTTSSRAIVFDREGAIRASAAQEFKQIYPRPGWVEHDPEAIWRTQVETARTAIVQAKITPDEIAAIGITNQRETTVIWERTTGRPIHNAIVWQCRRTADICNRLKSDGLEPEFRAKTGLVLDAYFSGTKVKWLLDNVPGARIRAGRSELCFGTIDSWLLYRLTGMHATDYSNASRTLMFDIHALQWDDALLRHLDVPAELLPQARPSSGVAGTTTLFGTEIPVAAMCGDQQSALFGQAAFETGECKNTYGTGCFALMNTGEKAVPSKHGLLTTIAWGIDGKVEYALEGSVFIGGAVVQWLRDELKLIASAAESETVARQVPDTGGVYLVPAFVGLGAPYWDSQARGTLTGLTRGSGRAHIVRAALESISFQSSDVLRSMQNDVSHSVPRLKVDGGASGNDLLMQHQADVLGIPVVRGQTIETTALGTAFLAGLATGIWRDREEVRTAWKLDREFVPQWSNAKRENELERWRQAVRRALTGQG